MEESGYAADQILLEVVEKCKMATSDQREASFPRAPAHLHSLLPAVPTDIHHGHSPSTQAMLPVTQQNSATPLCFSVEKRQRLGLGTQVRGVVVVSTTGNPSF